MLGCSWANRVAEQPASGRQPWVGDPVAAHGWQHSASTGWCRCCCAAAALLGCVPLRLQLASSQRLTLPPWLPTLCSVTIGMELVTDPSILVLVSFRLLSLNATSWQ